MFHGSQIHILYLSMLFQFHGLNLTCTASLHLVLKKIRDDTAEAIMIVPHWPTQSWFPAAIQICIAQPPVFGSQHLKLPGTAKKHPLSPKLELLALHVSGDTFKTNLFCQRQKKLPLHPGRIAHRIVTPPSLKNGKPFAVKGVLIPCLRLSQT